MEGRGCRAIEEGCNFRNQKHAVMSLITGSADTGGKPMAGWGEGDPVYQDKQLVIRHTIPTNGLTFSGVIDVFNADSVLESLKSQISGEGDLHIDLSRVEFCDVSGIRALISAAESSTGGRRIVLHGLPPLLQRVMTLVGWGDLPGVLLCDCGIDRQ